jgi:hypothetical protein
MMMRSRRDSPTAIRFAERRRREDDAPKLRAQVPNLVSLQLDIDDRRVVIDRAPALFVWPCGDPQCANGEHDLTTTVMSALRAHETSFHGEDACMGSVGPNACSRVLQFEAFAAYQP